jgi:hypothetical protein
MLGGGVVDGKDVDAIETTLIRFLLFERVASRKGGFEIC